MNNKERYSIKETKEKEKQKNNPIFLLTTCVVISTITIIGIKYPKETRRFANEMRELIQEGPNKIINLKLK